MMPRSEQGEAPVADVTVQVLRAIRSEIQKTNAALDDLRDELLDGVAAVSRRIDETNARLDETNARVSGLHGSLENFRDETLFGFGSLRAEPRRREGRARQAHRPRAQERPPG
jgi:uncharacterized coiled-coil DUF342 family protein